MATDLVCASFCGAPTCLTGAATSWLSSTASCLAAVLIRCLFVSVRRVSPVLRVVLPAVGLASTSSFVDVLVVVLIEIVVVVDVHIAVIPIAIAPVVGPCATHGDGRSPSQCCPRLVFGIGVRIIRIFGRCSPINYRGGV